MRRIYHVLAISVVFLLCRSAGAQTIVAAGDAAGTLLVVDVQGFAVTNFYLLAFDVADLTGWEASVSDLTAVGWNVLGATLNPSNAINVGNVGNFIVGLGSCVQPGAVPYRLVTYQYGYFAGPVAPQDVLVCIGPASPSSFGGAPGYATCADELVSFAPIEFLCGNTTFTGCMIINPSCVTIPNEQSSVGALKARY